MAYQWAEKLGQTEADVGTLVGVRVGTSPVLKSCEDLLDVRKVFPDVREDRLGPQKDIRWTTTREKDEREREREI